jgi:hypothetical protein
VYQNKLYARNVAKKGAEARLYAAMFAGLVYPIGAFSAFSSFFLIVSLAPSRPY